jgi:uncharacterized membrane protein
MASSKVNRLAYIDWMRGLAAVIMLQGHVFHAFTHNEHRQSAAYQLSQFVGGMPPAIFLFLTGVTLAFLMDGRERRGLPPVERVWAALRRAGYLLGVAFLFRLQLWVFGLPSSPWTDLFRVDILNCMALAVAVFSLLAVFRTVERIRLCAVLGMAIAGASPLLSMVDWSLLPQGFKDYLAPAYTGFPFFPWAAFLAFGMSAGSLIRVTAQENMDRLLQWAALAGTLLIMAGWYFSNSPYSLYPSSEFWLNSPSLVFIKLGVILWIGAFAFLWNKGEAGERWSWVRQFGLTSLLVYWVHIELVYGRWFFFWRENLDIPQTVLAAVGITLLMLGLSVARTNYPRWSGWRPNFRWYTPAPQRVPGD